MQRRRRRRRVMLVGGMMAYGAYKMSQSQADQIQQHTGIDPEELSDEDLAQAMDELGIEKQGVSAEDLAHASPEPAGSGPADLEQLKKLGELHTQGVLTDEEFAAMKAKILEG